MNYLRQTENIAGDELFENKKKALVSQLRKLQLQITDVDDYRSIQKKLGQIVDEIRPLAAGYSARVYDCSRKIQKTMGSNAAWATISMATLGLVKKPLSRQT
jgi:DNA anti-recombination protein RmuC